MFDVAPVKVFGTSSVGVFLATNNSVTFLPPDVPEKIDDLVRGTLRTSIARFTIAKSPLLGVFIVVNDNGVLLSPLALEDEVKLFKSLGLNVEMLNTKYTAVSNLILANNKTALVSPLLEPQLRKVVADVLGVEVIVDTVANNPLVDDNGVLLSPLALEDEVRLFKSLGLNVGVLNTKYTAISNLILANNRTALVSPLLEPQLRKVVADVLGVEVIVDTVANNPLVGALAVLNSRGLLVAPEATEEDIKKLSEYFKVKVDVGTVNKGKSFLRGGIVVNDHGALVGDETAGPELMRITQVLG
jgi:translation initiation factor 6